MEFLTNYKYFKDRLSKTTAILQDYCHHHFYLYHKNLSDNDRYMMSSHHPCRLLNSISQELLLQ